MTEVNFNFNAHFRTAIETAISEYLLEQGKSDDAVEFILDTLNRNENLPAINSNGEPEYITKNGVAIRDANGNPIRKMEWRRNGHLIVMLGVTTHRHLFDPEKPELLAQLHHGVDLLVKRGETGKYLGEARKSLKPRTLSMVIFELCSLGITSNILSGMMNDQRRSSVTWTPPTDMSAFNGVTTPTSEPTPAKKSGRTKKSEPVTEPVPDPTF